MWAADEYHYYVPNTNGLYGFTPPPIRRRTSSVPTPRHAPAPALASDRGGRPQYVSVSPYAAGPTLEVPRESNGREGDHGHRHSHRRHHSSSRAEVHFDLGHASDHTPTRTPSRDGRAPAPQVIVHYPHHRSRSHTPAPDSRGRQERSEQSDLDYTHHRSRSHTPVPDDRGRQERSSLQQPDLDYARHRSRSHTPAPDNRGRQEQSGLQYPDMRNFMCSKCIGRKRALCIGINYTGASHALKGCVNDAKDAMDFLIRHYNFKSEDIVLLTDDSPESRGRPTRQNILDAMHWLVKGAAAHDSLFFHYSGHGGQTRDNNGDERDGYDEVIYPLDYKRTSQIVDDEMNEIMVKPLPKGCRLTAIFDSCHSGSVLDLPYLYHSDGRIKSSSLRTRKQLAKQTPADIISWSGCMDSQTSADTFQDGVAVGAMSYAFIRALKENPNQTYIELLQNMRRILNRKYSQKPQLSSDHDMDMDLKFIM